MKETSRSRREPSMVRRSGCKAALILLTIATARVASVDRSPVTCYTNARWFTGSGFERRAAVCVVEGTFRFDVPRNAVRKVDLHRGFVVPPFGEAHNHNVDTNTQVAKTIAKYLERGIFYVKNPANLPAGPLTIGRLINRPDSADVMFSNGVLTSRDGHPASIVKRNIDRKIWTDKDGDGAFVWVIDTERELAARWPAILAGRPDFIKTMLVYSNEYEKRRGDPKYFGWTGLSPLVLPPIVTRAREAGLRVSSHVENALDFRTAVNAGVDEINHLPGFRMRSDVDKHDDVNEFRIDGEDAARAAKRGIYVVTTVGSTRGRDADHEAIIRANLQTLKKHSVPIALGSDRYADDTVSEAMYMSKLGIFDNAEILRMWSQNTAATIFPHRRIGHLRDGYEASFIVLKDDPLVDFTAVTRITLRVKQGIILRGSGVLRQTNNH